MTARLKMRYVPPRVTSADPVAGESALLEMAAAGEIFSIAATGQVKLVATTATGAPASSIHVGLPGLSGVGLPTVVDLPRDGDRALWTDDGANRIYLAVNHGGTIKTTELT